MITTLVLMLLMIWGDSHEDDGKAPLLDQAHLEIALLFFIPSFFFFFFFLFKLRCPEGQRLKTPYSSCFDVVNDLRQLSRRWWQSAFIGSSASRECFVILLLSFRFLIFRLGRPARQPLDIVNNLRGLSRRWWQSVFIWSSASRECFVILLTYSNFRYLLFCLCFPELYNKFFLFKILLTGSNDEFPNYEFTCIKDDSKARILEILER